MKSSARTYDLGDNVRVVTYPRQATLMDALGIPSVQSPPSPEEQLAKLAVPRAYFLYSRLPILAGSQASEQISP